MDAPEKLALAYERALADCLKADNPDAINLAYRFGHRALEAGLGILDFVNMHFRAVENLVSQGPETTRDFDWTCQAQFLIEALAPFEMVHRSFKEANEALEQLNAELDQRVNERTAELEAATEQLRKHRNEFIAMVGHEFKNPLSVIKGVAATAAGSRRPLDLMDSQEAFQTIDEAADKLRDLVDNLLDITRVEAGTLSINREPFDFRQVIDEATRYLAYTGDRHEVRVAVAKRLPRVEGDKRRIGQVLSNLLSNAAKFSDESAPIDVSALKNGTHVQIEVRDSGLGIPPERMGDLFQKFSQIHPGMKHKGTGLGLAICKGIVEAHGGRIWAESNGDGKGSAFLFTLPVARSPESIAT
ncbi:MAG: HAMP domain-containing sensor histidine kinase [Dehalococcoidia bacterium]